ncbi:uncharacterized protein BDR25DRAFT_321395 [Lindgomyces ingoldianus]|uniref:Uncharacterized protein n=1 Tax=Lindgomyces ingoldianus TaxID=673940 RepID=A0ACB6RJ81_9PLEO|nr:uncharacterized protein BDR25DRAFT_321395 [Lindgomyces ingoldianus]KAF2478400.1 hypothetical protein BDR25DRAFT_321395 [Lindgomyces ingoldianus]
MPPKKRISDSAPSPKKRVRGTLSALSLPPLYTHTFKSRLRELQPKDAIVAPAKGSKQATLALSSKAANNAVDKAFNAYLKDNYSAKTKVCSRNA